MALHPRLFVCLLYVWRAGTTYASKSGPGLWFTGHDRGYPFNQATRSVIRHVCTWTKDPTDPENWEHEVTDAEEDPDLSSTSRSCGLLALGKTKLSLVKVYQRGWECRHIKQIKQSYKHSSLQLIPWAFLTDNWFWVLVWWPVTRELAGSTCQSSLFVGPIKPVG